MKNCIIVIKKKIGKNEVSYHLAENRYSMYEYFHEFKGHLQFLPIWPCVCELGNLNEKSPMSNAL